MARQEVPSGLPRNLTNKHLYDDYASECTFSDVVTTPTEEIFNWAMSLPPALKLRWASFPLQRAPMSIGSWAFPFFEALSIRSKAAHRGIWVSGLATSCPKEWAPKVGSWLCLRSGLNLQSAGRINPSSKMHWAAVTEVPWISAQVWLVFPTEGFGRWVSCPWTCLAAECVRACGRRRKASSCLGSDVESNTRIGRWSKLWWALTGKGTVPHGDGLD